MTELGDLINSFDDFKLSFSKLIDELQFLNAQLKTLNEKLNDIDEDLTEIYSQLDMLAQLKTISTFLKEISEKFSYIQDLNSSFIEIRNELIAIRRDLDIMAGIKKESEKVDKEIEKAKKAVKISTGITPNQYKYIYTLINRLSDAEKKSVEEISNELYKKYGKKLTEFSVGEASELIDYLKERIKKARKKRG